MRSLYEFSNGLAAPWPESSLRAKSTKSVEENSVKVSELIEELSKLHPDSEVILQKDGEGNGYSPLAAVDGNAVYVPDSTWSGDVYSMGWTAEDACKDKDEWAEIVAKPRCVVLAPTN